MKEMACERQVMSRWHHTWKMYDSNRTAAADVVDCCRVFASGRQIVQGVHCNAHLGMTGAPFSSYSTPGFAEESSFCFFFSFSLLGNVGSHEFLTA